MHAFVVHLLSCCPTGDPRALGTISSPSARDLPVLFREEVSAKCFQPEPASGKGRGSVDELRQAGKVFDRDPVSQLQVREASLEVGRWCAQGNVRAAPQREALLDVKVGYSQKLDIRVIRISWCWIKE